MPESSSRRKERPTVSSDVGESKEVKTEKQPCGFDNGGMVGLRGHFGEEVIE